MPATHTMTVRELMELLAVCNQDAVVCIASYTTDDEGDQDNLRDYPIARVDVGPLQPDDTYAIAIFYDATNT